MIEKTFIMLKPDCISRGLVGEIITRIERKGFMIEEMQLKKVDSVFLDAHYSHIVDKPFYKDVVEYMISGPVLGMCVVGENSVFEMRKLIGPTNLDNAAAGTIRGDYAISTSLNLIHGSDSVENATIELERFFK